MRELCPPRARAAGLRLPQGEGSRSPHRSPGSEPPPGARPENAAPTGCWATQGAAGLRLQPQSRRPPPLGRGSHVQRPETHLRCRRRCVGPGRAPWRTAWLLGRGRALSDEEPHLKGSHGGGVGGPDENWCLPSGHRVTRRLELPPPKLRVTWHRLDRPGSDPHCRRADASGRGVQAHGASRGPSPPARLPPLLCCFSGASPSPAEAGASTKVPLRCPFAQGAEGSPPGAQGGQHASGVHCELLERSGLGGGRGPAGPGRDGASWRSRHEAQLLGLVSAATTEHPTRGTGRRPLGRVPRPVGVSRPSPSAVGHRRWLINGGLGRKTGLHTGLRSWRRLARVETRR